MTDARRKSSNSTDGGAVSVSVPLSAQQIALAAAEAELMTVMNEMEGEGLAATLSLLS